MACIPPNPIRVGYIVHIHGPLDVPLYMGSIYTNSNHWHSSPFLHVDLSRLLASCVQEIRSDICG